jgi:hypothetical protein
VTILLLNGSKFQIIADIRELYCAQYRIANTDFGPTDRELPSPSASYFVRKKFTVLTDVFSSPVTGQVTKEGPLLLV